MRWLRLVGSLKSDVSFAKEPYKRDDILQQRPIFLRSPLIEATPYHAYWPSVVRQWVYTAHADILQCVRDYTPHVLTFCSAIKGIYHTCWHSAVQWSVLAARHDILSALESMYHTYRHDAVRDREYTPHELALCSARESVCHTHRHYAVRYRAYATRTDIIHLWCVCDVCVCDANSSLAYTLYCTA